LTALAKPSSRMLSSHDLVYKPSQHKNRELSSPSLWTGNLDFVLVWSELGGGGVGGNCHSGVECCMLLDSYRPR
jgi:hypothetical protein